MAQTHKGNKMNVGFKVGFKVLNEGVSSRFRGQIGTITAIKNWIEVTYNNKEVGKHPQAILKVVQQMNRNGANI